MHPSIIEPEDLLMDLIQIQHGITNGRLPAEPVIQNVPEIERTISIKAYVQEYRLMFILEIPIVDPLPYTKYRLYPFPITTGNQIFQIIIPSHKFLIINQQNYALIDDLCTEIDMNKLICRNVETTIISPISPCEVQLLQYSHHYENCKINHVSLSNETIQKIAENQWIGVFPNETIVTKECSTGRENQALMGSYIISLQEDCTLQFGPHRIRSYKSTTKKIEIPQLPKFTFGNLQKGHEHLFHPIHLNDVKLDKIRSIDLELSNIQEKLYADPKNSVYFNQISIWTIIIYIFVFALIMYVLAKRLIKIRQSSPVQENPTLDVSLENIGYRNPDPTSRP